MDPGSVRIGTKALDRRLAGGEVVMTVEPGPAVLAIRIDKDSSMARTPAGW